MERIDPIKVSWLPRQNPLAALAVAATGLAARALASSTLSRLKTDSACLRGVIVGNELLLIMGASEDLPWSDGAMYLGQEQGSNILTPTALSPSVPLALLEQSFKHQFPNLRAPYAVLPTIDTVVPLGNITLIQPEILKGWLEGR